ncbi:Cytochrome P452 monooxygenase [Paramyrothecium foliicola]|nr:Cytochrome P452 monooxygenase [Paramyrothecium foliicola]
MSTSRMSSWPLMSLPFGLPVPGLATVLLSLAITTAIYNFYYVWWRFYSYQGIPSHVAWAGVKGGFGFFSRGKASLNSIFGLRDILWDGYTNYSLKGKPFVLPNIVTGHEVILPPGQMGWLLEQPDSVLSQFETSKQFVSAEHTMLHADIADEKKLHRVQNLILRELTRDIDSFAGDIVDEIKDALNTTWGFNTQKWHQIEVYDVMQEITARTVNRVLVGQSLCRDTKYLQCSIAFAQYAHLVGTVIKMLPLPLQPVAAPVLTAYDKFQYRRIAGFIKPIIQARAAQFGPEAVKTNMSQPNDFIQWSIKDAYRNNENPCDPSDLVSKRFAVVTWAAIQSTAITITNALIDIAYHPDSLDIQAQLREEALRAARAEPASTRWSRASIAKLPKIDSVLTESLRLWGFVSRGVTKTVMAKEGITIPSGEHLPYRSKVGVANYGPQHDPKVYGEKSGFEFDPFRFSRSKDEGPLSGLSFVTTGEYYMGFSHGRHACPGRYFANHQLKLLLAQIVMRYDIEPIKESRPPNVWFNNSLGPPLGAVLRVKRREDSLPGYK